jgi:hypothetical protein
MEPNGTVYDDVALLLCEQMYRNRHPLGRLSARSRPLRPTRSTSPPPPPERSRPTLPAPICPTGLPLSAENSLARGRRCQTGRERLSSARSRVCRGLALFGASNPDGAAQTRRGPTAAIHWPDVGGGLGRAWFVMPRRVAATGVVACASRRRRRWASGRPGGSDHGHVRSAAETATLPGGPAPNGSS